jgi:DNA-binding LacI/PurR family transcriptional regulator
MSNDPSSPARIQDVAQRAGVSSATVSRVLAGKPYVSDAVRERVLVAIQELKYQPSRVARSLRVQTSKILGLIISDIENPFFTSLVRAVEDVAYENGYALFLCNSDEDSAKERLYVDLMYAERVAGTVIVPTCEVNNPCRKLIDANIPVVAVDRRILDLAIDTVVVDNCLAAAEIVGLLIEDGHHDIACIVGPLATTTGRERRDGYLEALQSHRLPVRPDLIATGSPKEQFGYQFTRELLDQPNPPTALFTGNNLLTAGALKAINERGLRVPEDIAIGAFDDMGWTSWVGPTLLVAAQPTYELGRSAADLLLKRIADRSRPIQTIVLKTVVKKTGILRYQ